MVVLAVASLNRMNNTSCDLYFKTTKLSVKGVVFKGSRTKICCDVNRTETSFPKSVIQALTPGCCLLRNRKCYTLGMRPCPGYFCKAFFLNITDPVDGEVPNFNLLDISITKTICTQNNILELTGRLKKNNVIKIKSNRPCKDPIKKKHIVFYKKINGKFRAIRHMCCLGNIVRDYSLSPKLLCCGLAGSPSPYDGFNNGTSTEFPNCCRGAQDRNTCEPANLRRFTSKSKKGAFQQCQPQAGLFAKTPILNVDLPLYSPRYYWSMKDEAPNAVSMCANPTNSSFMYLYSIQNLQDSYFKNSSRSFGLCCTKKDIYALDELTISTSCCITYLRVPEVQAKIPLACLNTTIGAVLPIMNQQRVFLYPACIQGGCGLNLTLIPDQTKYQVTPLISTVDDTLYGTYKFFNNFFKGNPVL